MFGWSHSLGMLVEKPCMQQFIAVEEEQGVQDQLQGETREIMLADFALELCMTLKKKN